MFQFEGVDWKFFSWKVPAIAVASLLVFLIIPIVLPSNVYRGIIDSRIEKMTGLQIEFAGDFDFSVFPTITMSADTIDVSGSIAKDVDVVGTIGRVAMEMELLSFLSGEIYIKDFLIEEPSITIDGDFTPQIPQWIRANIQSAQKQDVRRLEAFLILLERTVFDLIEVTEGTFRWNKSANDTMLAQRFRLSMEKPETGRDFIVQGDTFINDRAVDLTMRLQRPDNFLRGYRSDLNVKIDSSPIKVEFIGTAAHRRSFVTEGDVSLEIPSLYEFCRWFNEPTSCEETASELTFQTDLRLRDERLQMEKAVFQSGETYVQATGAVDFKKSKPEILGTVTIPPKPVTSLIGFWDNVSSLDFDDLFLEAVNSNFNVDFQGLDLGNGDLLTPTFNVFLDDGRLSVSADQIDILGGLSNMRLRWHKGIEDGYMDLRFTSNGIDLKRAQEALGKNYDMTGALKTSFEVQSLGSNFGDLKETARIYGEFSIFDGSFKNPAVIQSLNGQTIASFDFTEVKGRIKGDRGQISSQDIRLTAPFVDVDGFANYDFLNHVLKIQLQSQIPSDPPTKGYVDISGPLASLSLRTSANPIVDAPISDGLHSGLIPAQPDDTASDEENFTINESDLLD